MNLLSLNGVRQFVLQIAQNITLKKNMHLTERWKTIYNTAIYQYKNLKSILKENWLKTSYSKLVNGILTRKQNWEYYIFLLILRASCTVVG